MDKYVEREFLKFNKLFMVTSESLIKTLEMKAKKIINLSLSGKKIIPTQVDINDIIEKLNNSK